MFKRLGRWLKQFMNEEVTPEQKAISRQILENQLMALL